MKLIFICLLTLIASFSFSQGKKSLKISQGNWVGELALSDSNHLPFNIVISKKGVNYSFIVENGEEMIQLNTPIQKGDSLYVAFPFFNSELVFTTASKRELTGYWVNYNRKNYQLPFEAKKNVSTRFSSAPKKTTESTVNISGKWAVTFEPGTNSAYPAVGIFQQDGKSSKVSGTFLTETGDYRYLEGNIFNDSLYLSCFDGSHAFLFNASLEGNHLNGKFFSGKHWVSNWEGKRDENATLKNPDKLTYLLKDQTVAFELPTLTGTLYHFPEDAEPNTVTIIQIMGTWCPNCLDETMFYKELYDKYHSKGLEIISVGYEASGEFFEQVATIERLKNKLHLDFTFLVGGQSSKTIASEHFKMLNEVISFPTSIFIGRDGIVKRIHTGFNGPGTGDYYKEYRENTISLIESMLAH